MTGRSACYALLLGSSESVHQTCATEAVSTLYSYRLTYQGQTYLTLELCLHSLKKRILIGLCLGHTGADNTYRLEEYKRTDTISCSIMIHT
mmetsp:Transcript_24789/g.36566  ORF Transcript_24789/g.36566 Transcript_24789/m.36566 type:complete len:91 (+) Transcript_24789:1496-1768(+)